MTHYNNSPIENEFGFASSPLILDIDSDGDNEIISGTVNSLFGLDIKETAGLDNSWNIFKGNYKRTGYYQYTYCVLGDLNEDAIFNVIDIVSLVNIIVQEYDESQYNSCSADLNSDGIINVIDIVALVNLILDN